MSLNSIYKVFVSPFDWIKQRVFNSKTYKLSALPPVTGGPSTIVEEVFKETSYSTPRPIFFGKLDCQDFSMYNGEHTSRSVHLHLLENVTVFGRTEFILKNDTLFYPPIIDPTRDAFMAELEGWGKISSDRKYFRLRRKSKGRKYKRAISLLGQCNGNYLHFLTEVLTRLTIADSRKDYDSFPLLIENNLHPRLYEALDLLNVKGREILRLSEYDPAHVDRLIYITPPCYTPPETRMWFERKLLDNPRSDQFSFSPDALRLLRQVASSVARDYVPFVSRDRFLNNSPQDRGMRWSDEGFLFQSPYQCLHSSDTRRFYCERRPASVGNGRLVKNEEAVISHLRARSFASVNLADFGFSEQVLMLQGSETVVSAVGAAVGNLIFVEPGVSVVLLSPTYPGASFFYFANLLGALGHSVTYVLGKQDSSETPNLYNRNFWAPVGLLTVALGDMSDTVLQQGRDEGETDHKAADPR